MPSEGCENKLFSLKSPQIWLYIAYHKTNKAMITLKIIPNGLEISLEEKDKAEFLETYPDLMPDLSDLLDSSRYLGNGWSDVTGHIGLTEAPAIGHNIDIDDNGNPIISEDSEVFYFPDYMIINEWETLYNTGKVIFKKV